MVRVEDFVSKILEAVLQDYDMHGMTVQTASKETAEENFKVSVGGQHQGAAPNLKYPCFGVLTEVMDVPTMQSSPPGLRWACLIDQT